MKKIFFAIVLLMVEFASHAQITMPATYKYTKRVFGEPSCEQITSYFIFNSANDVIWCLESSDGYIFPIAFGSCNFSSHNMVFNQSISSFSAFYDGPIRFSIYEKNGGLEICTNNEYIEFMFDDNGTALLRKCDYTLSSSKNLVGSSWKFEDYNTKEKIVLYFKSKTEVLLDGEPHGYILIGNTVGILSGDNPAKEALVGKYYDRKMNIHRSGYTKREYPWFELDRIN